MTDINTAQPSSTEASTRPERVRPVRKSQAAATPPTKTAQMSKLLARTRGATMAELGAATGWKPHSIRALLSGMRKRGVSVLREPRKTGETAYRIETAVPAGGVSSCAAPVTSTSTGVA